MRGNDLGTHNSCQLEVPRTVHVQRIDLPRRVRDFRDVAGTEMPLCTTLRETVTCTLLICLIGATGIGIGVWYSVQMYY
jgi:hypothetical protein